MPEKTLTLALSVQEEGKDSRTETFTQESVTVGAGSTADLVVGGNNVSDIHAMFDASRGNEVFIMDLGSASGTFVNDKKVNKQKLQEGDVIKLGDVTIGVSLGDEKAAAAADEPAEEKASEEAVIEAEDVEPVIEEEVEAKEETKEAEAAEEPVKEEAEAKEEVAEAKEEEVKADAPVKEEKQEAKKEKKSKKDKKAKKEAKKEAKTDIALEEEKALEEKKAAFEAKKMKARRRKRLYTLNVLPEKHVVPSDKSPVFEVREILWDNTLVSIHHLPKPAQLELGEKKKGAFFVSSSYLPGASFVFIDSAAGGTFGCNFTKDMEGTVIEGDKKTTFKELIKQNKVEDKGSYYQLSVKPSMAIDYRFGGLQYYCHLVNSVKFTPLPLTKKIDYPITSIMVILFLFYTLMTIHLKSLPAPEVADILDAPERFAKLILEPIEMEEPPPPEEEKLQMRESEAKAMGEEGKVGEEESVVDKADGSARKRLEDEKVANSSGILGALDQGNESMEKLFGGGDLGAGLEKNLGMLEGITGLDMRGAGGLGVRGAGFGGGGAALGIGGLGTKGRGGGRGGGLAYGVGASGKLKKRSANINIKTGAPTIAGALDKSIIARIIKKHYSQIRYCYQKELNKNPKLYGKITVKFTISGRGTVQASVVKVSTMKNFQVEQCVAKTIKRIIFPQPKGGGIVVVTYPFIFKAEGS